MASYLPQQQFMDVGPGIAAFRQGTADARAASQENLLRRVGETAATQGLNAAGIEAMRGGDVATGIKLQDLPLDRQAKLYDFMGRGAAAADTPEKWQAFVSTLAQTFGPESVRGFEDFRSRESAIMLSMNAKEQAMVKLRQKEIASREKTAASNRDIKERELALRERALAGKPKVQKMKDAMGNEVLVQVMPDGTATPIDIPGQSRTESPIARNIKGGLENLRGMTETYDNPSFENAVGPFQGSTPDGLISAAPVNIARAFGEITNWMEGGKSAPSEIRANINGAVETLAAAIKPLIRKPGEGVWTDADQARLVSIVGDLSQARDKSEFKRRLKDVADRLSSNFGIAIDFDAGLGDKPAKKAESPSRWTDPVTGKEYNVRDGKLFPK